MPLYRWILCFTLALYLLPVCRAEAPAWDRVGVWLNWLTQSDAKMEESV